MKYWGTFCFYWNIESMFERSLWNFNDDDVIFFRCPECFSATTTELALTCFITLSARERVFPVETVTVRAQCLLLFCCLLDCWGCCQWKNHLHFHSLCLWLEPDVCCLCWYCRYSGIFLPLSSVVVALQVSYLCCWGWNGTRKTPANIPICHFLNWRHVFGDVFPF